MSVTFNSKNARPQDFPISSFQATKQGRNDFIKKFICIGPKCYQYEVYDDDGLVEIVRKTKGLKYTCSVDTIFNEESDIFERMVMEEEEYYATHCNDPIPSSILRPALVQEKQYVRQMWFGEEGRGDRQDAYERHGNDLCSLRFGAQR